MKIKSAYVGLDKISMTKKILKQYHLKLVKAHAYGSKKPPQPPTRV